MSETFTQRRRARRPGVTQLRKLIMDAAATPDPHDPDDIAVEIDDVTAERIADAVLDWVEREGARHVVG